MAPDAGRQGAGEAGVVSRHGAASTRRVRSAPPLAAAKRSSSMERNPTERVSRSTFATTIGTWRTRAAARAFASVCALLAGLRGKLRTSAETAQLLATAHRAAGERRYLSAGRRKRSQ